MNTATVPLPRKRESSLILCRPQGDPFSKTYTTKNGIP